jgi:hypothetical protein
LKELLQNLKTRSGSYSGLDASIQANKQAQKSHATVPLKKNGKKQRRKITTL